MKVWVCYEVYYDGYNVKKSVVKVVDSEYKAQDWVGKVESTEYNSREYEKFGVK